MEYFFFSALKGLCVLVVGIPLFTVLLFNRRRCHFFKFSLVIYYLLQKKKASINDILHLFFLEDMIVSCIMINVQTCIMEEEIYFDNQLRS